MKKTILLLALLAAGAVNAQVVVDGAAEARSRAESASQAGASSGSQAGAVGNAINYNPTYNTVTPDVQTYRQEGTTTQNSNVRYSGVVENRASGGYTNTDNVNYSGTQTLKNVPGIAMSGPASGPCTGNSGGIGLAGPGWGVGLNGSGVMVDCRLRENSRVLGMAMQSFDGTANPQEKGEVTVMFMDSLRALAGYNDKLVNDEKITPRGRK